MYLLTKSAQTDIEEIAEYIAQRNPIRSIEWIDKLLSELHSISLVPTVGTPQPKLGFFIKSYVFGRYLIYFREIEQGIEIIRVLNGTRVTNKAFFIGDPEV